MNAKIVLQREKDIIAIAFGYVQETVNSLFKPVAVAVTKDSVLVYDDSKADSVADDTLTYKVKREIPATFIKLVTRQRYLNGEMKGYSRIILTMKGEADPFIISFDKDNSKGMSHFFNALSFYCKVETKEAKTKTKSVIKDMKKI